MRTVGRRAYAWWQSIWGRSYSAEYLRRLTHINRQGVTLLAISDASECIGIRTLAVKISYDLLANEMPLPCILHWRAEHFVIAYKVEKDKVCLADPGHGLIKLDKEAFLKGWLGANNTDKSEGIALALEPTPGFHHQPDSEEDEKPKKTFSYFLKYILAHKKLLIQLGIGFLAGSILQVIFPFLTQSVVGIGIANRDLNFVYIILAGQLMLFFSQTSIEMIRGWILLYVGARVSISIISDFLSKLMKLPLAFFDSRTVGDILQRIGDHERIKEFLTANSIGVLFSLFNLIIFSGIMFVYTHRH